MLRCGSWAWRGSALVYRKCLNHRRGTDLGCLSGKPSRFHSRHKDLATILLLGGDTMTKATLIEERFNWRVVYSFRGLVCDHHGRKRRGAGVATKSFTSAGLRQGEG